LAVGNEGEHGYWAHEDVPLKILTGNSPCLQYYENNGGGKFQGKMWDHSPIPGIGKFPEIHA